MHPLLKAEFQKEMAIARELYHGREYRRAFTHLERAHVLGQRNAIPHTINHGWMLKVGFKLNDIREILGQLARLAVAGIGSLIGRAPVGNTGDANVGILTPMRIAPDLAEIFRKAGM